MKQILLLCMLCMCITGAIAQERVDYKQKPPSGNWVRLASKLDDAFFQTQEAKRIADNVLLYQHTTGGWPKNTYMPAELNEQEMKKVLAAKNDVNESTIDNTATSTEIRYLSRMYLATKENKYKDAALKGIQYLFDAQYANGGWPQFYPRPEGYYIHITYNDNAMVNVLGVLKEIYEKQSPYTFIPNDVCTKARIAFDKGIDCILKTQYRQDGKLTVWCAQHDRETLAPAKARAYELPSLSGQESDNIVLLLMSLPNPTPAVIASVEGAVAWFNKVKIEGLQRETYTDANGEKDYKMVPCTGTDCQPMWARFYDLDTNRAFFCDRDGIKKYDISEIGHERRTGYSWYNSNAIKLIKRYESWKKELK